jgi:AcrR family transcriptional regulator
MNNSDFNIIDAVAEHSCTKERILDAAEKLFAVKGYHNTSLREITSTARVNLASVNYHFGSKEKLLKSVFERRLIPLNDLRFRLLDEVEEKSSSENRLPGVREILEAFVRPTLTHIEAGEGWREFSMLVGRALNDPDNIQEEPFLELVIPLFRRMFDLLSKALPDVPGKIVFLRLYFSLGVVQQLISGWKREDRFEHMPEMKEHYTSDIDFIIDVTLDFIEAGTILPGIRPVP